MFDNFKQGKDLKSKAEAIKRDLEAVTVKCDEVRGISIRLNGTLCFQSIEIPEDLFMLEKKRKLEEALVTAINASIKKAQIQAAQKVSAATGFPIPGENRS